MKIGVVTYHHAFNYGAVLQAYALCRFLNQLGHQAKCIDYRPPAAVRFYWKGVLKRKHTPFYLVKAMRFKQFAKHHLPMDRPTLHNAVALPELADQYDALITGSDQVWYIDGFRGFDKVYFLDFAKPDRTHLLSYAPSFGSMTDLGPHASKAAELLKRLHHISVRDEPSALLVEKLIGHRPPVVLDPTFLIDYPHLLSGRRPIEEQYLLTYGVFSPPERRIIRAIAEARGLKVANVGYSMKGFADWDFLAAGPQQWLDLYAHASFVVTNYFHGTIFSIIFQKPFVVSDIKREDKRIKITDLLSQFDMMDRAAEPGLAVEVAIERADRPIDYQQVGARREQIVQQSKQYLVDALNG